MPRPDDLSGSHVALHQDSTLIAVIEMSQSNWLVAGMVPGLARHPLKKLEPDHEALLRLLRRACKSLGAGPWVPAPVGSWLAGERGLVPKLVWRVKLVAEPEPGVATETEVAHIERGNEVGRDRPEPGGAADGHRPALAKATPPPSNGPVFSFCRPV